TKNVAETALLRHSAVDDERGRLVPRFIAAGGDVEVLAERGQVRRRRVFDITDLDGVIHVLADEDLLRADIDGNLGRVPRGGGGTQRREEHRAHAPAMQEPPAGS